MGTVGRDFAPIGRALSAPARSVVLNLLLDGSQRPASELARAAGVSAPTASEHLAVLVDAGLVTVSGRGRQRFFRIADPAVASALEQLGHLCPPVPVRSYAQGRHARALARARLCYDHLAGRLGIELCRELVGRGWLGPDAGPDTGPSALAPTAAGRAGLTELGIDVAGLAARRRPLARPCPDWTERQVHLAGALGAAIAALFLEEGWVRRRPPRGGWTSPRRGPRPWRSGGASSSRRSARRGRREALPVGPGEFVRVASVSDLTAPGLLPAPVEQALLDGEVRLSGRVLLAVDPELGDAARWWRRVTDEAFGTDVVPMGPGADDDADVVLALDEALPAGGYTLTVGRPAGRVRVAAADAGGAHAAVQTLRQLAGPDAFRRAAGRRELVLPACRVSDAPRFGWRGVLLDVARHFLPKADVLRFVDLAAAHRLDVVQLHLGDDQGWRFESRRHPRLTEVGSWRAESTVGTWRTGHGDGRPHGGFYTQDDLREIDAFARERGVTLVPEIDVPGHVQAVLAAYPHLAATPGEHRVRTTWGISTDVLAPTDEALDFFRDLLDEVCEVFTSPFVAIGGDEVPTTAWRERPDLVARAADLGYRTPDGRGDVARLHGWFLARLAAHLHRRGRRAVVWDEGLSPDLPPDAVVTCWRGWAVAADALAAGHDVVLAPEQVTYLDHRAGDGPDEPIPVGFLRTVADVYAFEPLPVAFVASRPDLGSPSAGRVLGGQAQVWSEHLDSPRRVDYATFPRLAAFAEAVWSPSGEQARDPGSAGSAEFLHRLRESHLPRLDALGVEYRPLDGPAPWQCRPGVAGHPRDLAAELAAGGWAGVGGWVEGRGGPEGSEAGPAQ